MFSLQQKREIADAVHRILRDTEHPELPKRGQPIKFHLHVAGAESWSWGLAFQPCRDQRFNDLAH